MRGEGFVWSRMLMDANRCPNPKCDLVFVDFNGCFALTCHSCSAGFCAWCLAHCGTDAHAHVAHCPKSLAPGNVFSTLDKFYEAHRERQSKQIMDLLRGVSSVVAQRVVSQLRVQLRDAGHTDIIARF
jgi:hypothetical protein